MPPRTRAIDRGAATGRRLVADLARELEAARLEAGLSYAEIGRAIGITGQQVGRICQGRSTGVSIQRLARLFAIVGMTLSARAFPDGAPVRDRAHLDLLARFRAKLHPALGWRTEVPVVELPATGSSDHRTWDAAIDGLDVAVRVEAETHIHDLQALERRIRLKQLDGRVGIVILAISDSRHHRDLVRASMPGFAALFPGSPRTALSALRHGRSPAANVCVIV